MMTRKQKVLLHNNTEWISRCFLSKLVKGDIPNRSTPVDIASILECDNRRIYAIIKVLWALGILVQPFDDDLCLWTPLVTGLVTKTPERLPIIQYRIRSNRMNAPVGYGDMTVRIQHILISSKNGETVRSVTNKLSDYFKSLVVDRRRTLEILTIMKGIGLLTQYRERYLWIRPSGHSY